MSGLLASSFSRYDQYAVNRIDERIELWTYTLYESDLLNVELRSSEEVPSIKSKQSPSRVLAGQAKPSKLSPAAKAGYDLGHHLAKMSPTTRALFELLREEIVDFGDDVTERFMNQYVGCRRLENFCEIVGMRSKLNVFIDGPIDDPSGICEDVSKIGHWGTGNLRATIASEDDVAAILPLVSRAYALQQ